MSNKAEARIRSYYQSYFLTEPILFSVVNTHVLTKNNEIKTLRTGNRKIEYNEDFINNLDDKEIKTLLLFEAFRILSKHMYERKKSNPIANYTGSNVTVQEYLSTQLEMPKAASAFANLLKENQTDNDKDFLEAYADLENLEGSELESITGMSRDKLRAVKAQIPSLNLEDLEMRHFEYYYNLVDQNLPEMIEGNPLFKSMDKAIKDSLQEKSESENPGGSDEGDEDGESSSGPSDKDGESEDEGGSGKSGGTMEDHFDPMNAFEQTQNWSEDDLVKNEINSAIQNAQITDQWGSVPGHMQDKLIASMKPKVDYKAILKSFKSSILSSDTTMTRMKPNRRTGWRFPGKKRDFTTSLAVFMDVSGSMSDKTLQAGFSIVNKFFSYGLDSIDVYQFDTELKDENPVSMLKAKKEFQILGRGGTDFQCIVDKLNSMKTKYDGVLVYTDGYARGPKIPKGYLKKKILWLYDTEQNYNNAKHYLKDSGKLAFVKSTDGY